MESPLMNLLKWNSSVECYQSIRKKQLLNFKTTSKAEKNQYTVSKTLQSSKFLKQKILLLKTSRLQIEKNESKRISPKDFQPKFP